jgi:hypothetical protein
MSPWSEKTITKIDPMITFDFFIFSRKWNINFENFEKKDWNEYEKRNSKQENYSILLLKSKCCDISSFESSFKEQLNFESITLKLIFR